MRIPAIRNFSPKSTTVFSLSIRDPRDRHLIGIINPDESGEDNSPRFDEPLGVPHDISLEDHLDKRLGLIEANKTCDFDAEICMKKRFWVKDAPFNAIFVKNLEILIKIADILGKERDADFCGIHLRLTKEAMRKLMFKRGVFYSTAGTKYEKLRVETWAHFAPLFAGMYTNEEALSLVENYLFNKETFWSPYGLRTVSKKEESYDPKGFWRGSVWFAPHWFVFKGLKEYGFEKEAQKIKESTGKLLEKSGFREYFDPETGEGYGAENFTWGALINDMI